MNWVKRATGYAATGRDSGLRVEVIEAYRVVDDRTSPRQVLGPFETAGEARDAAERMTGRVAA